MEKINRLLGRSKTFNSYDSKRKRQHTNKDDDVNGTLTGEVNKNEKTFFQHLAKVSNPSDPQGTLKRLETENLRRSKIKQITGHGKPERKSLSSEDIIIRKPTASPKPLRQRRTITMFDFIKKSKKSPLPPKKSQLKGSSSSTALPQNADLKPQNQIDIGASRRNLELKSSPPRKYSLNMASLRKKPAGLSSYEIDISDNPPEKEPRVKQLKYMRTFSRSLNDVMRLDGVKPSVKLLKEQYKNKPIMGKVKKEIQNNQSSIFVQSKRRSSLPVDLQECKRDNAMANQHHYTSSGNPSSPSNVTKNSQFDLLPRSPNSKYFGDSTSNEDNQNPQKTSTNRKTIKNILQRLLTRRPTQLELVTKGIIQDQRIFGNSLRNLCQNIPDGQSKIPEFVSVIMNMIQDEKNVVSHGIYRASGNIATIQKIRIRVNEGKNLDILKEYKKEVDVLTGSFKLFFRELTEALISPEMFTELCNLKDKELTDHDRIVSEVDQIIKRQPDYHRDVLIALIDHILYVNSFGEKNSMSIDSMSIVWGPSLIFTDNEDGGMLLQRMTNNNSIVKFLLNVYNKNYSPNKRLYKTESTLSLASTPDKSSISRLSFKQQHSVDNSADFCSIDDIELLIKAIQNSEIAKQFNVYDNYKQKKCKKIMEKIKGKKPIDKYTTTKDGLFGIVEALKKIVTSYAVVPEEFLKDYDGSTLQQKDIEASLERLPANNKRILELVLNHLNDMRKINSELYLLLNFQHAWVKVLFVNYKINQNSSQYFVQLLEYYQKSQEYKQKQSTLQKQIMSEMNESLQLRSARLSESESSLDSAVLKRNSIDVEIRRKSQIHQHEELQERKRSNRNS